MRMSAGDRVMAENYLQHAEHYNRIIAAAQAQMPIQQVRELRDEFDEDGDDDRDDMDSGNNSNHSSNPIENQAPMANGSGPQPVIEGTPAEVALNPEAAPAMASGRASRAPTASTHPLQWRRRTAAGARGARAAVAVAARSSKAATAKPRAVARSRSRAAEEPPAAGNRRFPIRFRSSRTDRAARQRPFAIALERREFSRRFCI